MLRFASTSVAQHEEAGEAGTTIDRGTGAGLLIIKKDFQVNICRPFVFKITTNILKTKNELYMEINITMSKII